MKPALGRSGLTAVGSLSRSGAIRSCNIPDPFSRNGSFELMGWSYRKRIRIFPGVAVNLSRSGPSLSIGGRGFTTNYSSKGETTTFSVPGTGWRYRTNRKRNRTGNAAVALIALATGTVFVLSAVSSPKATPEPERTAFVAPAPVAAPSADPPVAPPHHNRHHHHR
jgi:hypothetical protein